MESCLHRLCGWVFSVSFHVKICRIRAVSQIHLQWLYQVILDSKHYHNKTQIQVDDASYPRYSVPHIEHLRKQSQLTRWVWNKKHEFLASKSQPAQPFIISFPGSHINWHSSSNDYMPFIDNVSSRRLAPIRRFYVCHRLELQLKFLRVSRLPPTKVKQHALRPGKASYLRD